MRFCKQHDLRWISHRDLARAFERLFRRAGMPLAMSAGFRPKPRISFPSALALGVQGLDEVVEVELTEPLATETILAALRPVSPPGLEFTSVEVLPPESKKAVVVATAFELPIPESRREALAQRLNELGGMSSLWVERQSDHNRVDVRAALLGWELSDGLLSFKLETRRTSAPRAREVLMALEIEDLVEQGACLTRNQVELQP